MHISSRVIIIYLGLFEIVQLKWLLPAGCAESVLQFRELIYERARIRNIIFRMVYLITRNILARNNA